MTHSVDMTYFVGTGSPVLAVVTYPSGPDFLCHSEEHARMCARQSGAPGIWRVKKPETEQ